MSRIVIEHGFGETRLALVERNRLAEFRLSQEDDTCRPGSLHLGRVVSVDEGLAAAFVDIGAEKPGLLPLRDAGKKRPSAGDAILVQVTRPPVEDKGVRLSARPALAGRGMTLRPGRGGIAFAAGLDDPQQRERIRNALQPVLQAEAGLAVTRGALVLPAEVLRGEAERLIGLWRRLAERARLERAPALLEAGSGAIEQALLDWASPGIEIVCNDRGVGASVAATLAERLPDVSMAPRLEPVPALFEAEGLEEQLEAALLPEAPILGGGFLVIESGRTLTAIDVNSGGGSQRPREVNFAAADEIAHQLRLRGIGGLVVIDFIDLKTPSARPPVLERLGAALAHDPAGCELAGATRLGLVELTRRRRGPSLAELLTEPCGRGGGGRVRRAEVIATELLRRLASEARAAPGRRLVLTSAPEIAAVLAGGLAAARGELEARLGRPLEIVADPSLPREGAHIRAE